MTHNATPDIAPKEKTVVVLAGLRRRFACLMYELILLVGLLAIGFFFPWAIVLQQWGVNEATPWMGWLEIFHIFVLTGLYFIYSWHRHGLTLAMRTWRLRIVTADGQNLSWSRAFLRYILACISLLCFGVGILWAFFDLDNLFLHDRLAGTRVVFQK